MENLLKNKNTPYVIGGILVVAAFLIAKNIYSNDYSDSEWTKEDLVDEAIILSKINYKLGNSTGVSEPSDYQNRSKKQLISQNHATLRMMAGI